MSLVSKNLFLLAVVVALNEWNVEILSVSPYYIGLVTLAREGATQPPQNTKETTFFAPLTTILEMAEPYKTSFLLSLNTPWLFAAALLQGA